MGENGKSPFGLVLENLFVLVDADLVFVEEIEFVLGNVDLNYHHNRVLHQHVLEGFPDVHELVLRQLHVIVERDLVAALEPVNRIILMLVRHHADPNILQVARQLHLDKYLVISLEAAADGVGFFGFCQVLVENELILQDLQPFRRIHVQRGRKGYVLRCSLYDFDRKLQHRVAKLIGQIL